MTEQWADMDDKETAIDAWGDLLQHIKGKTGGEEFMISWPVDQQLQPLGFTYKHLIGIKSLSDITWHDVPDERWLKLSASEQENLKRDIWYYARTSVPREVAKAAGALAERPSLARQDRASKPGAVFALDDCGDEEYTWLADSVKMSLHDWVNMNRRTLQAAQKQEIEEFVQNHSGKVTMRMRKELELTLEPAHWERIAALEGAIAKDGALAFSQFCLLYTSTSPRA